MIEVKQVIDGEFKPKNLFEILQASVLIEDMQAEVNKGKTNVFGWVLECARVTYGKMQEQAKGWNDVNVTWQEAAAAQFHADAQAAITAGEIQYSKKQLDGFKNAVRTIHYAMKAGADLTERDDKSGAFKLQGKSQLEQWNKKHRQDEETKAHNAAMESLKAQGFQPKVAGKTDTGEAETDTGKGDTLDLITDPKVRKAAEDYVLMLAEAVARGDIKGALSQVEASTRHLRNHVTNSLKELKKAANG